MATQKPYDIVILGAGMAGLSLARQLLLETEGKTILMLERRGEVPSPRQKVGESLVQLAGFYFSRVLDLEEHLFRRHLLKYNLRFYWPTPGAENSRCEEYSKNFIKPISNLCSYQLDRNVLEEELLRLNLEDPRFTFRSGVAVGDIDLQPEGLHTVHFSAKDGSGESEAAEAHWVVDTSGRGRVLAKKLGLKKATSVRHGSFFIWVDGLLDVDKLTDLPLQEIRKKKERRSTGHMPAWLATNHFMGDGYWFWVIPLQGKTSLGVVYDPERLPHAEVFSKEKLVDWVCRTFPLFARDLPQREILDFGGYRDYSYDCSQTLSAERWAMTGEAGRFSDPLYSPGSDLIALHNTLIIDAMKVEDPQLLAAKCRQYEQMMRALYSAYMPSYLLSYETLGNQEVFALKYTWELTVYFGFYVFPFINDLFTDRRFGVAYMRKLAQLGPINRGLLELLREFHHWRRANFQPVEDGQPTYFDFMEMGSLRKSETTFYEVGASVDEAKRVLGEQLANLEELARYVAAYVASEALGEPRILHNRRFVEGLDVQQLSFDPKGWAAAWAACRESSEIHEWSFCPKPMERFRDRWQNVEALQAASAGRR